MTAARQLGLFSEPPTTLSVVASPVRRDAALAQHERRYAREIDAATKAAHALADRGEIVTMPRVCAEMRSRGDGYLLANTDTRWLGAVLLDSTGWRNTEKYLREGSKARPVPVWVRK